MRSIIGTISMYFQIILMAVTFGFIFNGYFESGLTPGTWQIVVFCLVFIWFFFSIYRKIGMEMGVSSKLGFLPVVIGIVSAAAYLIVFNPPMYATSDIGIAIAILCVFFFLVDAVDFAIQSTCKI